MGGLISCATPTPTIVAHDFTDSTQPHIDQRNFIIKDMLDYFPVNFLIISAVWCNIYTNIRLSMMHVVNDDTQCTYMYSFTFCMALYLTLYLSKN